MKPEHNNLITYAIIGLIAVLLLGQRLLDRRSATSVEVQAPTPAPRSHPAPPPPADSSSSSKLLKISLSLSSPQDLKVQQGDTVAVGEVLADRVEERSRLTVQRQALDLTYRQIQGRTIATPPAPMPVPTVKSLPPISYAEEEAAIRAAAVNIEQAQRALALEEENAKTEPLEESAGVQKAKVELQKHQREVDIQHKLIDAVARLKNVPPAVPKHEQVVLKRKELELKQAQAEYKQAIAKLDVATRVQTEKLASLQASLEKARADRELAIAKLQTKKDQRAYTEYEASVAAARLAQERNQATQNYYRQLQEVEQQQRERSFQLAQVQAQIAEVEDNLQKLSVVTSRYAGVVRRVKILQQNDTNLSAELTLAINGAAAPNIGTAAQPFTPPSWKAPLPTANH